MYALADMYDKDQEPNRFSRGLVRGRLECVILAGGFRTRGLGWQGQDQRATATTGTRTGRNKGVGRWDPQAILGPLARGRAPDRRIPPDVNGRIALATGSRFGNSTLKSQFLSRPVVPLPPSAACPSLSPR